MRDVDYLIIGAGLSGLVLKHFLENERTVLIDPEPGGYKIGESIIPELFRHPEIKALLPKVQQTASYTPKWGTTFIGDGAVASFPLPEHEVGIAMHVGRLDLDTTLREAWGIPIVEERVVDVDLDARIVKTTGDSYRVAKQIIDCSGPNMFLARRLNEAEEIWPVYATWAYFDVLEDRPERFYDVVRERGWNWLHYDPRQRLLIEGQEIPGWQPGRTTTLTKLDDGMWTWQIPICDGKRLSFGLVSRTQKVTREQLLDIAATQQSPNYTLRRCAEDESSPYGRLHTRNRFAYKARRAATQDYILVGDAFAFADPVYSVGTGIAVNKALEVAWLLNTKGWDEAVCATYCEDYEQLIQRALRAYEFWYSGETMASEEAANEVAQGFLEGHAFHEGVRAAYGEMLDISDLSARVEAPDPFAVDWGGGRLDDALLPLLGELGAWRLQGAWRCTGAGIQARFAYPGVDEELVVIATPRSEERCYRRVAELDLSYLKGFGAEAPQMAKLNALFDTLQSRIEGAPEAWRALVGG